MYRQKTGRRQYAQRPTANLLLGLPATSLRGVDFFHFLSRERAAAPVFPIQILGSQNSTTWLR
jgi:hypothetical protein